MTYVLVAVAVGMLLSNYLLINLVLKNNREKERMTTAHTQTMQALVDRILHADGKTWTPPPLRKQELEESQEELDKHKRLAEGWTEV